MRENLVRLTVATIRAILEVLELRFQLYEWSRGRHLAGQELGVADQNVGGRAAWALGTLLVDGVRRRMEVWQHLQALAALGEEFVCALDVSSPVDCRDFDNLVKEYTGEVAALYFRYPFVVWHGDLLDIVEADLGGTHVVHEARVLLRTPYIAQPILHEPRDGPDSSFCRVTKQQRMSREIPSTKERVVVCLGWAGRNLFGWLRIGLRWMPFDPPLSFVDGRARSGPR